MNKFNFESALEAKGFEWAKNDFHLVLKTDNACIINIRQFGELFVVGLRDLAGGDLQLNLQATPKSEAEFKDLWNELENNFETDSDVENDSHPTSLDKFMKSLEDTYKSEPTDELSDEEKEFVNEEHKRLIWVRLQMQASIERWIHEKPESIENINTGYVEQLVDRMIMDEIEYLHEEPEDYIESYGEARGKWVGFFGDLEIK